MRTRMISSPAVLALTLGLVAGCGGHSGSGAVTGPGGGTSSAESATVQGQIVRTQTSRLEAFLTVVVLRQLLGVGVAEAATVGGPVAGATVNLLNASNVVVMMTTTDVNGNFLFVNVPPGVYTIQVVSNGVALTVTSGSTFVVGAGDTATIAGTATFANTLGTQVAVAATDVEDLLQNDAQLCHAINIARASHLNVATIIALRQRHMGWGQIAHQEGVDSSVIGLHGNCNAADLDDARSDDGSSQSNSKGKGKGQGQS